MDESRPSAGPETIALFRGYSRIVVCRYAASLKVENKAGTKALVQSWSFFFFFLAFLSETIYSWHVQSTTLVDVLAGLSGRTREEAWAFAYAILSSGRLGISQKSKSVYCFGKSAPWTYPSI